MKNIALIILLLACLNGFAQSNFSLNIVAKYGQINIAPDENPSRNLQFDKPGNSFSFGIVANQFINKRRSISMEYGLINQIGNFSATNESSYNNGIEEIFTTSESHRESYDVLLPLKMKMHWKGLSIGGGIVPTYHFQMKATQNHSTKTSDGIFESESTFSPCQAIIGECFRPGKFAVLNDLDLQYAFDISYEVSRVRFFLEYSNYLWTNDYENQAIDFEFIDLAYYPYFDTEFGSSFNFGAAFRIY